MSATHTCANPECGNKLTLDSEGQPVNAFAHALARTLKCDECAEAETAAEREFERIVKREARRSTCGLPKRYRGTSLADLSPRSGQGNAYAACREWASAKDAGSLLLTGSVGGGKTVLAAAACWTRLERWGCKYVSMGLAMARLNGSFTDDARQEAVRGLTDTGAAVLDDLDKARSSEFGREQVFAAIDGRQQAEAPLLVTTNLTPDQIGETYGDALMSRLAAPHCRVVEVGGPDHRVEES